MTTPQALRCAEHPDVETYLRCAECDKPICPRCMVQTPVGAKCREHARLRKHPLYNATPLQLARGAGAAVGAGVAVGALWGVVAGVVPSIGILGWFAYMGIGYVVGQATSQASNRKHGRPLQIDAVAGTVVAFVASAYVPALLAGRRVSVASFIPTADINGIMFLLLLAVACYVAASRVR